MYLCKYIYYIYSLLLIFRSEGTFPSWWCLHHGEHLASFGRKLSTPHGPPERPKSTTNPLIGIWCIIGIIGIYRDPYTGLVNNPYKIQPTQVFCHIFLWKVLGVEKVERFGFPTGFPGDVNLWMGVVRYIARCWMKLETFVVEVRISKNGVADGNIFMIF